MVVRRLGGSGRALFRAVRPAGSAGAEGTLRERLTLPNLRRNASNTWSAVHDAFLSTKAVFENHRAVFTIGTSIASILTAWAGYSLRQLHQSKIEKRLETIEHSLKSNYDMEHQEIKRIVSSGNVSTTACVAAASTSLVIGYALGWRGGAWYANRTFRREQLRSMGQTKQQRQWRLFPQRFIRFRNARPAHKSAESPAAANIDSPAEQHVQKI